MTADLVQLSWTHPRIGEVTEAVCGRHLQEVRAALYVLGIGCAGTDQHAEVACLRCSAHPAKPPRVLLRQWFGATS